LNATPSFPATLSQEVREVGSKHSLQGPEFKVAIGSRYFWVGALTLKQLRSGYSADELGLYEIDPDDEPEDDRPINHTAAMRRAGAFGRF